MKRKRYYAAHRWLGLVTGLQLLLWSAGGLIFATHDIEWVRGNEGRKTDAPTAVAFDEVKLSPAQAAQATGLDAVQKVQLSALLDRPVYLVDAKRATVLVDAHSGAILSPITEKTAVAIAKNDRVAKTQVVDTVLVTTDPDTEYREKPLPAWRLILDDADNTHIYVSAATGAITARRNDAWRRFDFFWMLHTMDYWGRDDFNTPWLIIFASLGLISVLSGWTLWLLRFRKRARELGGQSPTQ